MRFLRILLPSTSPVTSASESDAGVLPGSEVSSRMTGSGSGSGELILDGPAWSGDDKCCSCKTAWRDIVWPSLVLDRVVGGIKCAIKVLSRKYC
jgi:hypothetical protein